MGHDGGKDLLEALGVPVGAARPPPTAFDHRRARQVVTELAARDDLDEPTREALAAWLGAFRHHWPERFAETFGSEGDPALRRMRAGVDPNRFLKLRRIAVESLARVL